MKNIVKYINHNIRCWNICGDLKSVALLQGMQLGYTKFCRFICEWNSRDCKSHYNVKNWPSWVSLTPGKKNVVKQPLVDSKSIFLPTLAMDMEIYGYGKERIYLPETKIF